VLIVYACALFSLGGKLHFPALIVSITLHKAIPLPAHLEVDRIDSIVADFRVLFGVLFVVVQAKAKAKVNGVWRGAGWSWMRGRRGNVRGWLQHGLAMNRRGN